MTTTVTIDTCTEYSPNHSLSASGPLLCGGPLPPQVAMTRIMVTYTLSRASAPANLHTRITRTPDIFASNVRDGSASAHPIRPTRSFQSQKRHGSAVFMQVRSTRWRVLRIWASPGRWYFLPLSEGPGPLPSWDKGCSAARRGKRFQAPRSRDNDARQLGGSQRAIMTKPTTDLLMRVQVPGSRSGRLPLGRRKWPNATILRGTSVIR